MQDVQWSVEPAPRRLLLRHALALARRELRKLDYDRRIIAAVLADSELRDDLADELAAFAAHRGLDLAREEIGWIKKVLTWIWEHKVEIVQIVLAIVMVFVAERPPASAPAP